MGLLDLLFRRTSDASKVKKCETCPRLMQVLGSTGGRGVSLNREELDSGVIGAAEQCRPENFLPGRIQFRDEDISRWIGAARAAAAVEGGLVGACGRWKIRRVRSPSNVGISLTMMPLVSAGLPGANEVC